MSTTEKRRAGERCPVLPAFSLVFLGVEMVMPEISILT